AEGGVLAIVKPMLPALSAEDVSATIEELREAALEEEEDDDETVNGTPVDFDDEDDLEEEEAEFAEPPSPEEIREGMARTYRRLLDLDAEAE
ncbi:MAG TPA: hypothetical protein VF821_09055, partial [Lentzea sp.]